MCVSAVVCVCIRAGAHNLEWLTQMLCFCFLHRVELCESKYANT